MAEILSSLKKTVSIILVIIVSVGYGVVKPRLGSTLQKVVGVGLVYFLLCSIEAVVRVSKVNLSCLKICLIDISYIHGPLSAWLYFRYIGA